MKLFLAEFERLTGAYILPLSDKVSPLRVSRFQSTSVLYLEEYSPLKIS